MPGSRAASAAHHVMGGLRMSWLGATDDPRAIWWTVLVTGIAVALAVRSASRRVG